MACISVFTSPKFAAVIAAGGFLLLDPAISAAQAKHNLFDDFPVVIACEHKGTQHAFYLSRVTQDGTATYVASDKIAGTVSIDGKAKAVGGPTGGNCVGKTLTELRASGQAHDLKP